MRNLGKANDWHEIPKLVVNCGYLNHFSDGTRVITQDGDKRLIKCEKCDYEYYYETKWEV